MSAIKEFHHDEIEKQIRFTIQERKDYPILFDTQMVRAIIAGTKTQTRRLFKSPLIMHVEPAHEIFFDGDSWLAKLKNDKILNVEVKCPYGAIDDLLWVKETWAPAINDIAYKADYSKDVLAEGRNRGLWHPSIHMPKTAARLWLQIAGISAQRLQDISEDDAREEGTDIGKIFGFGDIGQSNFREGFFAKWITIYGIESYHINPWVWAIKFKMV